MKRKKAFKRRVPQATYPKHLVPRGESRDSRESEGNDEVSATTLTEQIIQQAPPSFPSFFVDEPNLIFGNGELSPDPKSGLTAYGPLISHQPKQSIRVGMIGTGKGIDAARGYLTKSESVIQPGINSKGRPYDPFCFPDFPGIAKSFRVQFKTETKLHRAVPIEFFKSAVKSSNPATRLREVVKIIAKELEVLATVEPNPDVVVIVLPPEVESECKTIGAEFAAMKIKLTPAQKVKRKLDKDFAKGQGLLGLSFDDTDAQDGQTGYWNLHHALKARAMSTGLTTQVTWENTLLGQSGNQDPASTAWNFMTALYYKAGNIPWQLEKVPKNTCFVGISFYKENPHPNSDMQTSLAQVFSGAGEGLVLKGEKAIIDRKRDKKAHLDEKGAELLLSRAIATYEAVHQTHPARVVVHKTSRFWPEEIAGLKKGLGNITQYDFLALEHLGHSFMRCGSEPPLRGSVISLTSSHHVVYTQGYIPFLKVYPGLRIPNPLEIIEHHGGSPATMVCEELLALTKVNWNSCFFGSSIPITIRFAKNVGKILAELPEGATPQTKYKFYM